MNLEHKVAIVTGVSKGIGLSIAQSLLDKNVKVAGWSRSAPADLSHENFLFVETDVANEESVKSAYKHTVSAFGEDIRILINNAGYGVYGPIDETKTEDWLGMFNVNVHGIFYCTQAVVPNMKKVEEGHVINISSIAGLNPVKNMVGYAATKHAVTGLSHSLFMELRDFGIKVTCIYPGSVETNFFDKLEAFGTSSNKMMPEDIASTVVHCLESNPNYHHVDIEVRPLRPKG